MSAPTSDSNTNADSGASNNSEFTNDLSLSPIYGPHNKHQQIPLPDYSFDESDYDTDDSNYEPTNTTQLKMTTTRIQPFPEEHHDVEVVAVVAPDPETVRVQQLEEAKQRIQKQTKIRDACELTLYRLYKKAFPYIGPRREGESDEDYEARMNDLQVQKQLIKPVMSRYLDAEKIIWQSYRRCFELQAKHQ